MENNGMDMVEKLVRLAFWKVRDATPITYCKDCSESGILGDLAEGKRFCRKYKIETVDEGFCFGGKGEPVYANTDGVVIKEYAERKE